jgi:CDP-diacylglycerol--serine O-phosphatidyltransferase
MNIIKHIPNTITSANLFCGLAGVIFTFKGQFDIAFYLMLAAAVCDFCDGLAARLLNAYSDLGKELDSLADMVSFGALPALMAHRLMISCGTNGVLCYVPLLIAVFSAIRLAKFNIDERQTESFIGLATPACAMICGSFAYYVSQDPTSVLYGWASCRFFIPAASIILSFLLVSEIPMFSMKFKKNILPGSPIHKQRIGFIGVIVVASVLVLLLGLNWSMIILLAFISYIIMNIGIMLMPRTKKGMTR